MGNRVGPLQRRVSQRLWSIPRDRGRPCVFECRPIDLERREIFKVERLITELAKLVVQVGLIVLENLTTVVLLELSNRVAVVADFEVPRRESPRVVLIAAQLVPPTFEVPQRRSPRLANYVYLDLDRIGMRC